MNRHRANIIDVPRQSRHTSRRRVAEEVAARESARAQPERVTDRAIAVETKQPLSQQRAQSASSNQQQRGSRANITSHCLKCIGFKGAPVATRKNRLQLLHGGLKRVQERGARCEVADELRISAPPLGACACNVLGISAPSLDRRACIHRCLQKEPGISLCH